MVRTGVVAMTRGTATIQQADLPKIRPVHESRHGEPKGITHQWSA
jgi:hypothetical protein